VVPESQYEIPHSFKRIRPIGISLFISLMLPAVDFDDQLSVGAKEVGHEAINRYLSLELPAIKSAITQSKPQDALRIGLITAQSPRESHAVCHFSNPISNPLVDDSDPSIVP
jgi:hypothetical protein